MALIDTPDQVALAASVRQLVDTHSPLSRVRQVMDEGTGYDQLLWQRLAGQGLAGITIPEEHGGGGGSIADLAAALRELGRGLVPSPLVATVLAGHAVLHSDDQVVAKELLPHLATGDLVATMAVSEKGWLNGAPTTTAREGSDGVVLTGDKQAVLHGMSADVLLVHARDGLGSSLFVVRRGARGLEITAEKGLDRTTPTARVRLLDTPAERVNGDVDVVLSRVTDLANVVMACLQSGAMKQAVEATAAYATIRYSFGQPIGSYQGVKHKLADSYTDWCLADAATRRAVEAMDADEPEASADAAAARLLASPAYVKAAKQMMMLHGGIGFTWEHDAHLYYKNAVTTGVVLGDPASQRTRLVDLLGL